MQYEKVLSTLDEIKTFSDPFRLKILMCFSDNEEPMTVKQIAVKLGEVPAKVHYHVKELERINVLEIVDTREKSGILEKYYLPTAENIRIDKSFATTEAGDNQSQLLYNSVISTVNAEYARFSRHTKDFSKEAKVKMGVVYLTDEEFEEIDAMLTSYVNSKKKRPGTKAYTHSFMLFRKYENQEADDNER